jgi:hypothetical protein
LHFACISLALRLRFACVALAFRLHFACVSHFACVALALRLQCAFFSLAFRLRCAFFSLALRFLFACVALAFRCVSSTLILYLSTTRFYSHSHSHTLLHSTQLHHIKLHYTHPSLQSIGVVAPTELISTAPVELDPSKDPQDPQGGTEQSNNDGATVQAPDVAKPNPKPSSALTAAANGVGKWAPTEQWLKMVQSELPLHTVRAISN